MKSEQSSQILIYNCPYTNWHDFQERDHVIFPEKNLGITSFYFVMDRKVKCRIISVMCDIVQIF